MAEMYSGLQVGQRFTSLEEFKAMIRSISVRQHWELRVIRSNKKSVVLGCRSSNNCFFRVVCRANKNATYITSLQDSHSCRRSATTPAATPARSEASHVRFLLSEIPKLFDLQSSIKAQDVVDAVKRYHGYDISMRQAQRALTRLQSKQPTRMSGIEQTDVDGTGEDDEISRHQMLVDGQDTATYSAISDARWLPDPISDPIEDDTVMAQDQGTSSLPRQPATPSPPVCTRPRRLQRTSPLQQQGQAAPNNSNQPVSISVQPDYPRPAASVNQSPSAPPPLSKSQIQPHHPNVAHGSPPVLMATFKIEFTCTTCGAVNQSFLPNHGNVTGEQYIGQHPVPSQSSIQRHGSSSAPDSHGRNGTIVLEEGVRYQGIPSSNAGQMQPRWPPGPLGGTIGPAQT